jgi:hypothetical protein
MREEEEQILKIAQSMNLTEEDLKNKNNLKKVREALRTNQNQEIDWDNDEEFVQHLIRYGRGERAVRDVLEKAEKRWQEKQEKEKIDSNNSSEE